MMNKWTKKRISNFATCIADNVSKLLTFSCNRSRDPIPKDRSYGELQSIGLLFRNQNSYVLYISLYNMTVYLSSSKKPALKTYRLFLVDTP